MPESSTKPVWISAGELSGDMHAAELMAALGARDPGLTFTGMGGPHMRQNPAFTPLFDISELSVMGLTEVLRHLPRILGLLGRTTIAMAEIRPRALIVVDSPSFHFRVIKAAHALGIPIYYYISPKAWAWKPKRALFIKKHVRRLISILPFEPAFYRRFGMDIDYVGNPLVDMVDWPRLRDMQPTPGKIGLLPGSRRREIATLVPEFGKAARILLARLPHLSFHMVRAPGITKDDLRGRWPQDVPLTIVPPDDRYAFMRGCQMLIAASGTVTLEAALAGTPTIVTYKVAPLTYALGRALIAIPYVSLSNLILEKPLFPELLQGACNGKPLAAKALEWLAPESGDPLADVRRELAAVRQAMGEPGAIGRAADVILEDLALVEKAKS